MKNFSVSLFKKAVFIESILIVLLLFSTNFAYKQVTDPPVAVDDSFNAHGTVEVGPLANDILALDAHVEMLSSPTNGTASSSSTSFFYHPNIGYVGTDSFTYRACYNTGTDCSNSATITITVQNQPPVPQSDSYNAHGYTWFGNVVNGSGGDYDPDGDPITSISITSPTSHGTIQGFYNYDQLLYIPYIGYTGTDSLVYEICDNLGACASATVTIHVQNQAPVPQSDSYNVHGYTWLGNVVNGSGGDYDPEGDSITSVSLVSPTSHGTIQGFYNYDQLLYIPYLGYVGADSAVYEICDNLGACATATININVQNQAPVAVDDFVVVRRNSVQFYYEQNDYDPDGDELMGGCGSNFEPQLPTKGWLGHRSHGDADYHPYQGLWGYDSWTYINGDRLGLCSNIGTVSFFLIPQDGAEDAGASCSMKSVGKFPPNTGGVTQSVGEPVNVTNGNMWLEQTDYKLSGIGENIEINRFYNSVTQTSGLFGLGWSTDYDESIQYYDDRMIRANMPDGRAVYFARLNTAAPFNSVTPEFYGQIVINTDNTYTLTFKDGRTHKFSSTGKLLWQKDRNGNQTTLTYDTNGILSGVADAFGRTLTLTTSSDRVTQISDSTGTIADYAYNTDGTLQSVTYPDGSEYQFVYTAISSKIYLTTVKDALDNILESHEYDSSGRATTSEKHGGVEKYTLDYSSINDLYPYTTVTDALGRVTKYYFEKWRGRNVVTKIEGNCNCGGSSETTTFQYDLKANLVKKTDAFLNETNYTYDASGNRLTMTDSLGTETYTYNAFGEMLTETDRMNGLTTNTYNSNGSLLTTTDALGKVTTLTYTSLGQIATIKDARNKTTTLTYDSVGRLTQIKDANNKTTDYAYDARARVTSVTNALNEVTTYQYDLNNRLKKIIYPDTKFEEFTCDLAGRRTKAKDARGNETTFGYDNAYRLTTVTDALNHAMTFGYDLMSNRTSQTDALNQITNYEYDDFNRLKKVVYPPASTGATRLEESMTYDAVGNVETRTDTAGRTTEYDYDTANRLTETTDALSQVTQFEYNNRSQMTKVKDALDQEYTFTYDALGRQLSQTRAGTTLSYEYDAVGNRTKRTDYLGRATDYTFDNLNRLTNISYVNQSNDNVTYAYDDLSKLTSATNNAGTVSLTYDNRNRLKTSTDVFAHDIEYGYDDNGNRSSLKFDNANYANYAYDIANRLTSITNVADSTSIGFGYDNADRLTSKTLPNGITTGYTYDGMSRLKRLKDETSSTVLFDRQMSYNAANQISQILEPTLTRNFGYDDVDRLTGVTDGTNTATESYAFDGVGNRTSSHASSSYSYQSNNRLTASQSATFAYNASGNMTSKTASSVTTTFSWDYENRMTSASVGATTINYEYDALGRRTKRTQGTTTTKFIYDGLDVLVDDNAGILTKYLNGLGIDNKLRVQTGSTVNYFLADHLGSTNGLADSSGSLTASTDYDSFGNATNTSFPTRYQYTGREFDSFTGLHYYRARWYDANLGRFISEDPIGFAGGDINIFGYVWNNPIKYADPTGLGGWGSDTADYLDERIEYARQFYGHDPMIGFSPITGMTPITVSGLAFGASNMLRVGNGTAQAFCDCDENIYGRAAFLAMDIERASGLFSLLAGPFARFSSVNSCAKKPFLPNEYYNNKLNNRAPTQNAPFSIYERFDANGNLHQATTYDAFGSRVRQFDVGPKARHGEGYHVFDYDGRYPRQNSGGGTRSPQINF